MCVQLERIFKEEIFKYSVIFGPRHVIVYIHPMLNLKLNANAHLLNMQLFKYLNFGVILGSLNCVFLHVYEMAIFILYAYNGHNLL